MVTKRYVGAGQAESGSEQSQFPYLADERLVDVVNMAISIQRPLLIKGPPGCGKTQLAFSISHELGLPIHPWFVKSTSQATDGLYTIDVLRRLQDAHTHKPEAQSVVPYLRLGPLGEALSSNEQSVVLIDEIDKADIDFPNDLLRELDRMEFTIEELSEVDAENNSMKRTYKAKVSPIVIVTSNDEKELPDAFLRRCLFHYIDFPDASRLADIVNINLKQEHGISQELINSAVARFSQIRDAHSFRKQPATSELIDWVLILHRWGVDANALAAEVKLDELPYWEMLMKHFSDLQAVKRSS
ncbi:MAG: MoxR family ATPase [Planctomycetota bacterium]